MHSGNQSAAHDSKQVARRVAAKILPAASLPPETCPGAQLPNLSFCAARLRLPACIRGMRERAMDTLTIAAAGGMRARMESLDMLANNLANTETGGYKTDREFYNLYVSAEAAGLGDGPAATLPVIERPWTDFSQGTLRATGSPLDLALSGKGFFA